jgi:hypothetical protein
MVLITNSDDTDYYSYKFDISLNLINNSIVVFFIFQIQLANLIYKRKRTESIDMVRYKNLRIKMINKDNYNIFY